MEIATPTKVVAGPVRFSYAHVFKPTSIDPDDPNKKYSVSILVPKSDTKLVKMFKDAIEAAKVLGKEKWGGKIPATLKMPMRDGDVERPGDKSYEGMYFIGANSTQKPGIIDAQRNPLSTDEEFYSGCWGRVSVNFFPYNHPKGGKGVACGLNHIQKTRDDERLAGRADVLSDFSDDWQDDGASDDDLV